MNPPKYYEVVPITDKPKKEGRYMCFYQDGVGSFYYDKHGGWIEGIWILTHWLRPLTSIPIDKELAGRAWEAGSQSVYECTMPDGPCDFNSIEHNANKESFLKSL